MIICEKNEKADWLISRMINDKLLSLNPVIAGGAALYVYRSILYHDTDYKWRLFVKSMEKNKCRIKGITQDEIFAAIAGNFSDIDIWFMDNNPVFDKDNEFNYLVADNWTKHVGKETLTSDNSLTKPPHKNPFDIKTLYKISEWCNTFEKKVSWDNSIKYRQFNLPIQIITKGIKSVPFLLNDFDFVNCSVAWHNGMFYYNSNIDDAFQSFELRMNKGKDYSDKDILFRVYHANRAFKYAERFSLEFDRTIAKHILSTFVESGDIEYSKLKNNSSINIKTEIYGSQPATLNSAVEMVQALYNNFHLFYKMKSFEKDWPIYMVNLYDKIPMVRKLIEASGIEHDNTNEISELQIDDVLQAVIPKELRSGA